MSTETDIKIEISNGCAPRNALLCCRSPACLNYEPKLVYATQSSTMADQQQIYNHNNNNNNSSSNSNGGSVASDSSKSYITSTAYNEKPMEITKRQKSPLNDTAVIGEKQSNAISKSQSSIDIHGVTLRRVSPPKRPITVKGQDAPSMGVVLRKVEKKSLLEPPKAPRFEKSPPPRKLTNKNKIKHNNAASNNPSAIPKSKSTNDVALIAKQQLGTTAVNGTAIIASKSQTNLLKTNRPPLEIHRIEGDKIIIIRRIPKSKRVKEPLPPVEDTNLGAEQVTIVVLVLVPIMWSTSSCVFKSNN